MVAGELAARVSKREDRERGGEDVGVCVCVCFNIQEPQGPLVVTLFIYLFIPFFLL